ncbi:hypothetical protein D1AOALGA4SA_10753 [Olavius algarvensis Delta 1 endosymbiont]|nr:hypothetical protein D1AOALGA4SA_10753 [Olavius algarvensis Delta 1 endosymbiont]
MHSADNGAGKGRPTAVNRQTRQGTGRCMVVRIGFGNNLLLNLCKNNAIK